MTAGNVFEYTAVMLNVVGSVLIARQDRRGYKVFIIGFPPSAAFAIYYRHWWLLTLYVYYLVVNCYGFYLWRRRDG